MKFKNIESDIMAKDIRLTGVYIEKQVKKKKNVRMCPLKTKFKTSMLWHFIVFCSWMLLVKHKPQVIGRQITEERQTRGKVNYRGSGLGKLT